MAKEEDEAARRSAERLALALEDAGFDVGQEFPALHDAVGRQGRAVVRIGDVLPPIADRLASALMAGSGQDHQAEGESSR
ncbi:hypothetical protein [Couchioplanes caeruleus]|uniref:Uncharacterized protein n=2 Tax=Couchioplanes caeruleus TaxID=56438 RepID=A0A1K0FD38_9ACTN|nr:hypothetical protein [Couchioplanes caeruleus]OJF10737.1 hypothetical protein BG844_30200 [Couchioplanes caeruleus subsp. caeruleus]ROP28165.1 hypothetical protein EDD30_0875 [Couchioplanes caeruleus]